MSKPERDPLLEELEERILEGNVLFTPDEEFLRRVNEKRKEIKDTMESIDDEDELYEYISKEKKKFNGILLLIAHLYLVNMITFPIIEYVLRKLIHPFYENNVIPDEMNLEFLYNIYPIVNTKFTINNWRKIKDIKYAINYIPNDTRIPNRLRLKFMNLSDNNVK